MSERSAGNKLGYALALAGGLALGATGMNEINKRSHQETDRAHQLKIAGQEVRIKEMDGDMHRLYEQLLKNESALELLRQKVNPYQEKGCDSDTVPPVNFHRRPGDLEREEKKMQDKMREDQKLGRPVTAREASKAP